MQRPAPQVGVPGLPIPSATSEPDGEKLQLLWYSGRSTLGPLAFRVRGSSRVSVPSTTATGLRGGGVPRSESSTELAAVEIGAREPRPAVVSETTRTQAHRPTHATALLHDPVNPAESDSALTVPFPSALPGSAEPISTRA